MLWVAFTLGRSEVTVVVKLPKKDVREESTIHLGYAGQTYCGMKYSHERPLPEGHEVVDTDKAWKVNCTACQGNSNVSDK